MTLVCPGKVEKYCVGRFIFVHFAPCRRAKTNQVYKGTTQTHPRVPSDKQTLSLGLHWLSRLRVTDASRMLRNKTERRAQKRRVHCPGPDLFSEFTCPHASRRGTVNRPFRLARRRALALGPGPLFLPLRALRNVLFVRGQQLEGFVKTSRQCERIRDE